MKKYALMTKINFLLKNTKKNPICEITFLGSGGVFDSKEKNSSVIIKTTNGTILVDCGSTVFTELQHKNLLDDIDCVFITHCHEDNIGSLSTLIYYKYFIQNKTIKIECVDKVFSSLQMYLNDVCGHDIKLEQYVINSNKGVVYGDLNMIVHKVDTTNYHKENYASGGFVFNFRKNGQDIFIVYSGDVNTSFFEILKNKNVNVYNSLLKCPENVFVFHESTSNHCLFSNHCQIKDVEKITETFPNVYTYHHSEQESKDIFVKIKKSKQKVFELKKQIDNDLKQKIDLTQDQDIIETLKIDAKNLKTKIDEDLMLPMYKSQDLNIMGKELVIYEI